MPRPKNTTFNSHLRGATDTAHAGMRLAIEKRIGPGENSWKRTGSASSLVAAERHAIAIGGECRVVKARTGVVLARWIDGVQI